MNETKEADSFLVSAKRDAFTDLQERKMTQNESIPSPAQESLATSQQHLANEDVGGDTEILNGTLANSPLNLEIPSDEQRQARKLDETEDEISYSEDLDEDAARDGVISSPTSTPLTFTVTATRPPLLLKPSIPTAEQPPPTHVFPKSSPLQQHSSAITSAAATSSATTSPMQTTTMQRLKTSSEEQTTPGVALPDQTVSSNSTLSHNNSILTQATQITPQNNNVTLLSTITTTGRPTTPTLPPKTVEIVNIIPPRTTTSPPPVTLNFIYNRHTPPSSPSPPSTSTSQTVSSSSTTIRTPPPPNPVPPKPVPSYNVLTTPRARTLTTMHTLNHTTTLPPGPPMAPAAGVMGLGSGAEIGIAAGSIVAFWLLLGPLVCLICRLRERAAKTRSGGSVEEGGLTRNGEDELGHRLVEEMIRLELARGRHKLYKTNVQDEHETERLGDVGTETYVNTEFLNNIVQNDYAKTTLERPDSCEKLPLSNGFVKEPVYENTSKVPPPPPPPPPQKLDTSQLYANTTVASPMPPRSNGYVCSNNYPLSSAALYLAKSRQNRAPPPNMLRSPESEPVDGFMYSPRLLQRQLERAVRAEQKIQLKDGMRRSEKIFPKENFNNIRAEPKIHTKAGLVNGYHKLPTNLPKVSIDNSSIPDSPRIMHKDITEEEEEDEEEVDIERELPKSLSLSHSVERAIPLLNGEKYRITSSNPSIDSGKYMISNKTRSMERNGLKRVDLDRNCSDPWRKTVQQNGVDPRKTRSDSVEDTSSSLSSSPPKEEPEIQTNAKKLCDQGTQTLVDTVTSPWIGYRRPGVKDTVV